MLDADDVVLVEAPPLEPEGELPEPLVAPGAVTLGVLVVAGVVRPGVLVVAGLLTVGVLVVAGVVVLVVVVALVVGVDGVVEEVELVEVVELVAVLAAFVRVVVSDTNSAVLELVPSRLVVDDDELLSVVLS